MSDKDIRSYIFLSTYLQFTFHNSKTWTNKYHDVVVLYDVQRSIKKVVLDFSTSAEIQYYFFNTPLQTNIMNFVWSGVLKKWYWISALVLKSNTNFQYSIPKYAWRNEFWFISYYHGMLLHHSGLKRYWKILLVVMVITCESIEFITRGLRPLVIISILSLVITITTRNIFQYLLPGVVQLLIVHECIRQQ